MLNNNLLLIFLEFSKVGLFTFGGGYAALPFLYQMVENYNWFTQKDSWTEPCAVVDSLILALSFYRETGEKEFKTLARRIC